MDVHKGDASKNIYIYISSLRSQIDAIKTTNQVQN
jgi:hypothetical protein